MIATMFLSLMSVNIQEEDESVSIKENETLRMNMFYGLASQQMT